MTSRLTTELTFDHIDDWFKIGVKNPRVPDTVSGSSTGGRGLQLPGDEDRQEPVPSYRQNAQDLDYQQQYVEEYRRQWEEEMSREQARGAGGDVDARSTHCSLSDLESMTDYDLSSLPNTVPAELAGRVYQNYNFDHHYSPELPITEYSEQILKTIESQPVAIIQGPTGSGKTTQVPQYILDYYAAQDKHCNIIVTQPRRIAAISIARRVCDERRWQLGSIVGYQVGRDTCTSDDTRLTFATTGVLLQKLIRERTMGKYTHIILDEVHERDQYTDFALLVTRKLQRTNSRHVKIILMSATFDTSIFARYFAVPIAGKLNDATVVSVEGTVYDVQEHYLNDIGHIATCPEIDKWEPTIVPETYEVALKLILFFDNLEGGNHEEQGTRGLPKQRGSVLVFLPGYSEICTLDEMLGRYVTSHRLSVIPLHSSITSQEQARAFTRVQEGFRKIILSTNIAESSITVPDIKFVIDFMLIKCMVSDPDTNFQSLRLHWASKANAVQRKGRAGRVSSGRVYRLVTREFYEECIQEYGIPEMQRCPLEQLILNIKVLDLGEPKAILALALEPPNLDNIQRTVLLLKEVGALSTTTCGIISPNDLDGDLTFVGRVLSNLPVDIRIGKLIMLGYVFGCLKECLVIGAGLSLKSFFARPYKDPLQAYGAKLEWAASSFSDCIALLNAYRKWEYLKHTRGFLRAGMNEWKWGEKHMIQITRIREVSKVVEELSNRLADFNIKLPLENHRQEAQRDPTHDLLILKLTFAGAFYPNYFTCEELDETSAMKQLSGKDPCTTVMISNLPPHAYMYKAAIAGLFEQCGKGKHLYFEERKAFVEFEQPLSLAANEPSSILPAVYLAVKMRLLRLPMTIELYDVDEANVKQVEEAREQRSQTSRQLRTNRMIVPVDSDAPRQVALPPPNMKWIDVSVTAVVDGNRFWAHYADRETFRQLDSLMREINSPHLLNKKPLETAKEGVYCLAPFSDPENDKLYYRARVQAVQPKGNLARVFYLDYGNLAEVDKKDLRPIPGSLLEIPFQSFECVLSKIKPVFKVPDNKWPPQTTQRLDQLASNKVMTIRVFSVVSGTLRVDLYNYSTEPPQHINQILVKEKLAQPAEEPYVSKAHLRGPISPYEINFGSMTRVGRQKATRVERDSVNSVALSDAPEEKFEKMMIAATVGLNQSGNTLLARDTTLMPNIPDLPALVCMIFAPAMELRRDKKKTRLTGALCGLGFDRDNRTAVLPDHDIEVEFNTEITSTDIANVNGVRLAINIAIGSQDQIPDFGSQAIPKLQKTVRKKLTDLILKRRDMVKPVQYERAYQWSQVPPGDVLTIDMGDQTEDFPKLYQYHTSVVLEVDDTEQILKHYEDQRKHLDHLHSLASRSTVLFDKPANCWLCEQVCYAPRDVLHHLNTQGHIREQEAMEEEQRNFFLE